MASNEYQGIASDAELAESKRLMDELRKGLRLPPPPRSQAPVEDEVPRCENPECGQAVTPGARWCSTWCHTGTPAGMQPEA